MAVSVNLDYYDYYARSLTDEERMRRGRGRRGIAHSGSWKLDVMLKFEVGCDDALPVGEVSHYSFGISLISIFVF